MDYTALVRVLQGAEHLRCEVERVSPLNNALTVDILLKGNAVDVLHYDILNHIAEAYIVHLYYIGVREHGDSL